MSTINDILQELNDQDREDKEQVERISKRIQKRRKLKSFFEGLQLDQEKSSLRKCEDLPDYLQVRLQQLKYSDEK